MASDQGNGERRGLSRYVMPLTAWALAFGCSVGWGSFVMPGTTFLPIAGPLGSVAGLAIGAVAMLVIAANYHFLINRYPDPGGAFSFTKRTLGYDHGFLCAWFLALTYIAIIWANATALPIIARNLLGGLFQFGISYEIAGFHVYFGELLLAIGALLVCGFLCMRSKAAGAVQVVMAFALIIGIVVCFFGVTTQGAGGVSSWEGDPLVGGSLAIGVINIVALAPWAFVGFESISHSAGEFSFSPKKSFRIMAIAVVAAAAAYALLVLIAASAQPQGYAGWADYISNLGNLEGAEGLPTLFAIQACMGPTGTMIMGVAALGGIVTGLIGCYIAASRLLYSMANDNMLPVWFSALNERGVPAHALIFIMAVSVVMPFLGRTAISWIVDVTTVGAAIAYAYVSLCAFKVAQSAADESESKAPIICAVAGIAISAAFLLAFLLPNVLEVSTLSTESYLILAAWSILGFAFYRYIFKNDHDRRLGHSTVAWIVMLVLILFTSFVWVRQATDAAAVEATARIDAIYEGESVTGVEATEALVAVEMERVSDTVQVDSLVQLGMIVLTLVFLFDVFSIMRRREKKLEVEKALAEQSSKAKTSFLSNMSHEIRTPMNAIIGLDSLALKDPDLSPRTREKLEKIGASAKHLLGLINDILDMSRIESGRMALKNEEFLFRDFLDQINIIINGQCEDKGLTYHCEIIGHTDDYYVGDDMKLRQVLINILGNAVKFTDPPGTVTFSVEQLSSFEGLRTLRFTMSDTGIGMDADYLPTIFEAFSQEDATSTNKYGGSGLGMAITKNIVEMMNGNIEVESEKGVGTTFVVTVTLKVSTRSALDEAGSQPLDSIMALVVDDDAVACEHAQLVLSDLGIKSETFTKADEALTRFRNRRDAGNAFNLVLTDYFMPDMDGMQLTEKIRAIDNGETAIIILTGYSVDDVTDDMWAAGADGLMAKPLFTDTLKREIQRVVIKKAPDIADSAEVDDGAMGAPGSSEATAGEESWEDVLGGCRVLLAEDVEINAEIMMDLLDMEDISAEHAENGQVAVEMFEKSEPGYYDAVLMDVRMPVMDGLTAASSIRKLDHASAKTVPIIALTANAFDEDVQRSLQAGMDAHLSKPVEPDRLFETLSRLIKRQPE